MMPETIAKKTPREALTYWHNPGEIFEVLEKYGYVVVPKEPTPEMIAAGDKEAGHDGELISDIYRAMIAAAMQIK